MTYDDSQAWKDVSEHFPNRTIYYIYLSRKVPRGALMKRPKLTHCRRRILRI